MNHLRSAVTFVLCAGALGLVACAPTPPPDTTAADLAAIEKVRNQFAAAFNAGDASAIGSLYTDEGISLPPNSPPVSGKAAIVARNKAFFEQFATKMEVTGDETKVSGGWGFDRGSYKMTATPKAGGAPMNEEGKYIVIVQKQPDGVWKVTRDMDNSSMPLPAPVAATPAK